MAGLQPAHFISMACPHLGCRGEGAAQIPFMGWFSAVPLIGRNMQQASAPSQAGAQGAARPWPPNPNP